MSYQALYRKYRPKDFSDVKGQDHIVKTLSNELQGRATYSMEPSHFVELPKSLQEKIIHGSN